MQLQHVTADRIAPDIAQHSLRNLVHRQDAVVSAQQDHARVEFLQLVLECFHGLCRQGVRLCDAAGKPPVTRRLLSPSSCADSALRERRIGVHAREVPNGRKRSRVRFDAFDAAPKGGPPMSVAFTASTREVLEQIVRDARFRRLTQIPLLASMPILTIVGAYLLFAVATYFWLQGEL